MTDAPSPRCSSGSREVRQLDDLKLAAENFRRAMIQSGASSHVRQSLYMEQLRALESALNPLNYRDAAQAAREPGEEHPILKQCDELHDLGFAAGWQGAIEECAKIAAQTAKRCVRERTPGDSVAAFIERAILALPSTDRETVSPASYCALCDLEHPLHEDAQGFHHVIKGERVACPMSSTHLGSGK